MPKKLSTNTKSLESRERKAAEQKEKSIAEEKRKEDGENILMINMRNRKRFSIL